MPVTAPPLRTTATARAPRPDKFLRCNGGSFAVASDLPPALDSRPAKTVQVNLGKKILAALLLFCDETDVRAQATNAARTLEELRSQLAAHLDQPRFHAAVWGVKIAALDSGKTVFEHHADR